MKLVVTGALGHVGSGLIRALRPADADEVVLIDNLSTRRYGSLFALPAGVTFRFVEADVRTAPLADLFAGAAVVIHLAAVTGADAAVTQPDEMAAVNVDGTARVAEVCARSGCRLLFPSTTSVYLGGDAPVDEDSPTVTDANAYTASKLRAEQVVRATPGLAYCIARFGTIYGVSPGMRFETAVNRFCWQAATNVPLSVWRTAVDQSRAYLALDDAVGAVRFLARERLFDGDVFNVVTENLTVGHVIAVIRELVPEVQVNIVDSPVMNDRSVVVSSRRLGSRGFQCRGRLRDGVAATLALLRGLGPRMTLEVHD